MNKIKKRFELALNEFVERCRKNPNVVGILVSGSYVHSIPDKNSDLDVHVILKESKTRERGNTWINGVEIEYFSNPVKQIRYYFNKEDKKGRPVTAHMFANSILLYKKGNDADKLINEAKRLLRKKPKKMGMVDLETAKYFLDDLEKDLEDVYLKKDKFAFALMADQMTTKCLEIFYGVKRVHKEKVKRVSNYLKNLDRKFERLLNKAVIENNIDKKFIALRKLANYTEDLVGGKRPKEWKLKTKCDYS